MIGCVNVTDWLMESDPAICWQVMRDLLDAPAVEVAAERARVATHGWGAQLLTMQEADGVWRHAGDQPDMVTMRVVALLHELGLIPASEDKRHAIRLLRDSRAWLTMLPD